MNTFECLKPLIFGRRLDLNREMRWMGLPCKASQVQFCLGVDLCVCSPFLSDLGLITGLSFFELVSALGLFYWKIYGKRVGDQRGRLRKTKVTQRLCKRILSNLEDVKQRLLR